MTKTLQINNPFNGDIIETLPIADTNDLNQTLKTAEQGRKISRELPRHQRSQILNNCADIIGRRTEYFAELITKESGKIIGQARKEVARCQNTLRLSAIEASRNTGETLPFDSYAGSENRIGYFTHEPLGIIAAITPFNDPLNLVAHKVGPAIAGGNSVILKPSSLTPLSALALADALFEAGLPESVLSTLICDRDTGDQLLADQSIRMLSFTGGMKTGESITRKAGLKKLSMDLGGNAPVIVMPDCDLALAVEASVSGAFWANGQNCISVQRLLVHEDIYTEFRHTFVTEVKTLSAGDPMDENTDVGPMIKERSAKHVELQVTEAINAGATLLCGHRRDKNLYQPTVLETVPHSCQIWREEVFAPLVILERFSDFKQAITLANQIGYSLHAGIFTKDLDTALLAIKEIEAGGIMVNDSSDYRFDGMPFGGFKAGSMGREGVRFALEEMTQTKVACINISG
ncbi:MAG: aldehyde dehydrogenase family protein [Porticoccaceae bacterium]|nr:aldehyde dehydrogenase family protein [Porticoccaceae bacterium]